MIVGMWSRTLVGWLIVAAVLPAVVAMVMEQGNAALGRVLAALVVILFWQWVFLVARAQPPSPTAIVTAVLFAILAPGELAAWQIVLAVTFGAVVGEQIFGGWGRNVISPATAALAFVYFAFPEVHHAGAGMPMVFAALAGALILAVAGVLALSILIGAAAGLVAAILASGGDPLILLQHGSIAIGLVFLICDPVASAATRLGRWLYGGLAGLLIAVFGASGGLDNPQTIVLATLVASLFAPLLDAGVIAATTRQWRHSDG